MSTIPLDAPPDVPLEARPPPLVVTMGDACGIGPEVIARAFVQGELHDACVIGDVATMRRAAALLPEPPMIAGIDAPRDLPLVPPGCLAVVQLSGLAEGLAALPWGEVDARAGDAAHRAVVEAVAAWRRGEGAAIVTAPIHKEAFAAAGVRHPGHTELLQALAAAPGEAPPPVRMMLASNDLRVVLATIHLSLRRAIDALSIPLIVQTIVIAHHAARSWWGMPLPRIAVAGLNPHAGEGGLFGDEEITTIAPAIEQARALGIDASGPHPPDTVFMRARRGDFDLVVAMTHDHGLIPVKLLGVEHGVNVTLGLPFVRTSPDHGTAFDIAGTGHADPTSLVAAIRMARRCITAAACVGAAASNATS
jgi:4-hydroxythreonine-4-phosphate dehydrogenase